MTTCTVILSFPAVVSIFTMYSNSSKTLQHNSYSKPENEIMQNLFSEFVTLFYFYKFLAGSAAFSVIAPLQVWVVSPELNPITWKTRLTIFFCFYILQTCLSWVVPLTALLLSTLGILCFPMLLQLFHDSLKHRHSPTTLRQ